MSDEPNETKKVRYALFKTAFGWCAAARTTVGVCAFVLPVVDATAAEAEILRRLPHSRRSRAGLSQVIEAAERYFDGWTVRFDEFPLDLSSGTEFQQRVWAIVRRVPYGQVRTYRWVGMEMGLPAALQAIGAAVAANPVPLLVPCHRIVGSDGSLCGFSAPGGIELKAKMLQLESVRMTGTGEQCRVLA